MVPYDIPRGCAAAYYPETNVLVPMHSVADGSNQPASKSIPIRIEPSPDGARDAAAGVNVNARLAPGVQVAAVDAWRSQAPSGALQQAPGRACRRRTARDPDRVASRSRSRCARRATITSSSRAFLLAEGLDPLRAPIWAGSTIARGPVAKAHTTRSTSCPHRARVLDVESHSARDAHDFGLRHVRAQVDR